MDFVVPKLSATMENATVLRWLKQPGETFRQGEAIVELETDKSAIEVEAPADGAIEAIVAAEGETVPIGGPLARLKAAGSPSEAAAPASEPAGPPAVATSSRPVVAPSRAPVAPSAALTGRILASPLARRLAAERGLDLAVLRGTGPHGRIRKRDVLAAASPAAPPRPGIAAPSQAAGPGETSAPLSAMRSGIAESVALSRRTIPSFSLDRWVELGAVDAARQLYGPAVEQATGIKPTLTDFLLQAMADTLGTMPEILDRFAEANGRPHRVSPGTVDIGLVVAVPGGMMIPVVRDLAGKGLGEVARLRQAAVQRVRAGRLAAADAAPASISLSNLARSGIDRFDAIVSPGQSSILAAGREHERVIPRGGAIAIARGLNLTFSVDHRLIDGRAGAEYLSLLADRIERGPWGA